MFGLTGPVIKPNSNVFNHCISDVHFFFLQKPLLVQEKCDIQVTAMRMKYDAVVENVFLMVGLAMEKMTAVMVRMKTNFSVGLLYHLVT